MSTISQQLTRLKNGKADFSQDFKQQDYLLLDINGQTFEHAKFNLIQNTANLRKIKQQKTSGLLGIAPHNKNNTLALIRPVFKS